MRGRFNVGMVNSNGDILIFLDSDAYFEDDGIFKLLKSLRKMINLELLILEFIIIIQKNSK